MANRLADASSPYLQQHADNPVDWQEWGEDALAEARRRDVPLFLSVGYSSCHWCHVMAHESFEDGAVAEILNRDFVPVKVDREERPDVDAVYMTAVQALTGHGGWPMSVFLTPDGAPFFGGTYWPKEPRMGMPGFLQVLDAVRTAWQEQRDQVEASGGKLAAHLEAVQQIEVPDDELDLAVADVAAERTVQAWDTAHGGFGSAPKFPQAMTIDFLLAHHLRTGDEAARRAAVHSLEEMARGGIYDHVGGGFARYAVDAVWLVPHFEKMLYDNALLLRAYTHAWQVDGLPRFAGVARETADYLLAEMQHEAGGFFSSTDADSEGVEGKFFTWPDEEFREVVAGTGEDPDVWCRFFGVTPEGNFEGRNILHEAGSRPDDEDFEARLARVRGALYERRAGRVPPGLDDKVLTSWNGLVIGALAEAGTVLGEPRYVAAAQRAAGFVRDALLDAADPARPLLFHTWRAGHGASVPALLEDVAFLAQGLLVLYEADHDPAWYGWAAALAEDADARFAERGPGGRTGAYFSTPDDGPDLIARPKELWDNATPSGASVMADVHLRLAALTGDAGHEEQAHRTIALFAPRATQAPTGFGELLRALERAAGPRHEVAVVGDPGAAATRALLDVYREAWRPRAVLAAGEPGSVPVPLLAHRGLVDGRPAAYVCRGFVCDRPTTDPAELRDQLAAA